MMPSPCGPLPPAFPARPPHYVLPGSHLLDPAYRLWQNPNFPFPRFPLPFETQTRACGTGLIQSNPCQPVGCDPCRQQFPFRFRFRMRPRW